MPPKLKGKILTLKRKEIEPNNDDDSDNEGGHGRDDENAMEVDKGQVCTHSMKQVSVCFTCISQLIYSYQISIRRLSAWLIGLLKKSRLSPSQGSFPLQLPSLAALCSKWP